MLAADKLQLQSALKQQATALKEKEFNLHRSNMGEFQKRKERGELRCVIRISNISCLLIFRETPLDKTATIGTIAAVLAGLDITMFIEFTPHDDSTWVRCSKCQYT